MTAGTGERVTDAELAARFLGEPELFTEVPGGRGVLLHEDGLVTYSTDSNGEPEKDRLVMDPTTGLLTSTTYYVNLSGERHLVGSPGARITAEWTDVLPS